MQRLNVVTVHVELNNGIIFAGNLWSDHLIFGGGGGGRLSFSDPFDFLQKFLINRLK